jgi:hypothetical protein
MLFASIVFDREPMQWSEVRQRNRDWLLKWEPMRIPGTPDPAESMAAFYPLFYGHRVSQMDRLYQLMSAQAQFWSDSWETGPSSARTPLG